jgi:hypothetical protein
LSSIRLAWSMPMFARFWSQLVGRQFAFAEATTRLMRC